MAINNQWLQIVESLDVIGDHPNGDLNIFIFIFIGGHVAFQARPMVMNCVEGVLRTQNAVKQTFCCGKVGRLCADVAICKIVCHQLPSSKHIRFFFLRLISADNMDVHWFLVTWNYVFGIKTQQLVPVGVGEVQPIPWNRRPIS